MKFDFHSGPLRAFRHRNFRLFATGQVLSLAGTRIHEVAAGWLMWQLTGSATWLGLMLWSRSCHALLLGYVGDLIGIRGPMFVAAVVGFAASVMVLVQRKRLAPHLEVTAADSEIAAACLDSLPRSR